MKYLKKLGKLAAYLVLILVVSAGVDAWRSRDTPAQLPAQLSFQTLASQEMDVIGMSHQEPVLLYFWSIHCPFCKLVSPSVNWISKSDQVVSIALHSGSEQRVQRYLDAHDYSFQTVADHTGSIGRQLGIYTTPTLVVIKDGEIKSITTGFTSPMGIMARMWAA